MAVSGNTQCVVHTLKRLRGRETKVNLSLLRLLTGHGTVSKCVIAIYI